MIEEKKVIKGRLLDRVKAAEDSLAKEEAKKLEAALPEGHPLRAEVERQKAILGGDLSGLPPGHPLLRTLQAAREAYERSQAEIVVSDAIPESDDGGTEPRKARRLEEAAARKQRNAEEDELTRRREAAKAINVGVDRILLSVRNLWKNLATSEQALMAEPTNRAKILRMKQMLIAVERRFSETRLSRF
jgi:hypothetical protein